MAAMPDRRPRQLTVDGVEIGDGHECYVIAEVGHNHQGDVEQAKRLVDAAKECGVNAVKLQKRSNRALYTREFYEQPYDNELSFGRTYGEHREALELGVDDYRELLRHAREVGMTLFATPFDFESADLLAELDVPAFKFASGDLRNTPLQRRVAAFGKPMFLSTGGGTIEDVDRAVNTILPLNDQLSVLQCTAAYPARAEDLNLNVITTLRERFPQLVIGLSDHQNGISMALVAYMLGAQVIEKHFTLDHALKGRDHAFSLMPEGMRRLVRDLHRVPAALGDATKRPLPIEADPLEKMGKKLVAARELEQGHLLTAADLSIKSPADGGLPPYELDRLVGRRLRRAIAFEDFVTFDDVEPVPEHAGAHAAAQP
jgi:sialic acid synthase